MLDYERYGLFLNWRLNAYETSCNKEMI